MMATPPVGCSIFLVEDEVMIRMMVADMLEELGHRVAAEAGEIGEAVKLAQSTEFDLAILDVNVNGKVITPVAELITARREGQQIHYALNTTVVEDLLAIVWDLFPGQRAPEESPS